MYKIVAFLLLICMATVGCSIKVEKPSGGITVPFVRVEEKLEPAQNTPMPTQEPIEAEVIDEVYSASERYFELPVNGATAYVAMALNIYAENSSGSKAIKTLDAGTSFVILEEDAEWWKVDIGEAVGYVYHSLCFINLPDVLPSAVYENTNATSSVLQSSFTEIPNITGEKLYSAYGYNERLSKEEFVMPVLYNTANKIAFAQKTALAEGNTLIINELYRPSEVQLKLAEELESLSEQNGEVLAGISTPPWEVNMFISTSLSNHQRGFAMDTSLGKIADQRTNKVGEYEYVEILAYKEYEMQTPIHELSSRSASLAYPVSSKIDAELKSAPLNDTMTEGSILLRDYCKKAELSPLASEWWHFNDLDNMETAKSMGCFYINEIVSVPIM